MTTYNDIFRSVLAMDSYHRHNNQGVFTNNSGLGDDAVAINIGDFQIIASIEERSSSFYAIAYKNTATGEIIISYRGTDALDLKAPSNDIFGGWTIGAGAIYPSQLPDAIAFYERVIRTIPGYETKTVDDRAPSNVTLTGHSLGGGLAAVVASLSGGHAFVTDPMPYAIASWVGYFDGVIKAISASPQISALFGVAAATDSARYLLLGSAISTAQCRTV